VLIYPAHVGVDDRTMAYLWADDLWILCDALSPYEGDVEPLGTGCPPTPGLPNSCEAEVPAESSTMSDVKRAWH